jgi:UDP-2-acetamido-3-amino-2,3-dideoxy-glucuronate N-acetyltransferase
MRAASDKPKVPVQPTYFRHPQALVEPGAEVGRGSRVWAFAHLAPGSRVGKNCNVCDHTFLEGGSIVGNNVTIKCGVFLWNGVVVEDDVFIGPAAGFTNDLHPRSKHYPDKPMRTVLRRGCSIGTNATILCGLTLGRWSMIGAGAVVIADVADYSLVAGNPAHFKSWICQCARSLSFDVGGSAKCICAKQYMLSANGRCRLTNATPMSPVSGHKQPATYHRGSRAVTMA